MPLIHRDNPRICLLRLSAIGDVTHAIAVVRSIQTRYPAAKITWIVGKLEHKLLDGLPSVEFFVFDKSKGCQGVKAVKRRFAGKPFDVLLHMQVAMRANLLSRAIPAKLKIGFDKSRSRDFHGLFVNHRIPTVDQQHVLDGFMEFAKAIGVETPVFNREIPISELDLDFANQHLAPDRPNVIISPCSSHTLRNWNVSGYARIADYLVEKHQAHVLLCGGPSEFEKNMAQKIAEKCQNPVIDLTGQDTLKQFFALAKGADLLISPDSGPAHIGSAAGTPTIALHAASNPRRSGPYGYQRLTVDAYDAAALKYKGKSGAELKWGTKLEYPGAMNLIAEEMVIEKIELWNSEFREPPIA